MAVALLPYIEVLLFLAGTVLYGFLLRELLRHPDPLPAERPLQLLAGALLLWYGGTLFDHWLVFLIGPLSGSSLLGALLDVARGLGWLLALPLLLHVLEILAAAEQRRSLGRLALVGIGYASLGLFVGPIHDVLASGSPFLADATTSFYPRLVLHAGLCLVPAAWIAWLLAGWMAREPRLTRFLRSLSRLLVLLLALLALGLITNDIWSPEPSLLGAVIRLLILGALLLPGILFAFFVQRYNLLRLSLSNRFLRQFGTVLIVVLLVMLAGPALGVQDTSVFRPFIAWGLLLALGWSVFSGIAVDRLVEHSATWRVFLGHAATAPRLEGLMGRLESLSGDDEQLMSETAKALSEWFGCEAEFLPRTLATESLWRYAEVSGLDVAHRLTRLPRELNRELDRHDLQAVFVVRAGTELRGLLGLCSSATGGWHGGGELEGVSLVLRQLGSSLLLRRLARERVAEERRAAEQERLGMLGLVSASLAHEIKNPLSSMKVLAQALREELAEKDPDGEAILDLDAILDQIERLGLTTREILSFARARQGDRTDLSGLLHSAVYVLRAEAKKRSVELESEIGEACEVHGSPAAWQTIAFNLLRNAVDHTPGQGVVRLGLGEEAGRISLEVSNPGRLDSHVRDRLFEPFHSGTDSSGLGLSLVARRAEELGAAVTVREVEGRVIFRVEAPAETELLGETEPLGQMAPFEQQVGEAPASLDSARSGDRGGGQVRQGGGEQEGYGGEK